MDRLAEALKIRPGEGRMAALAIGLMLLVSAGSSIGSASIDALFFSRFGVQFLPTMYVVLGVTTFVSSMLITGLLGRVAHARLFVIIPLVFALILIGERAVMALNLSWFYPVIWLFKEVMNTLAGIFTWGLAGLVTDTRQAKRLFPLFTAGSILGGVLGAFSTPALVNGLRAENMLLMWAGALAIAFVLARALIGRIGKADSGRTRLTSGKRPSFLREMQEGYQFVRRSPLMRQMSIAAVLFSVLFFSLSLPFSRAATAQFTNEDALAGFLATFQGLFMGGAVLVSLFLANRLFARFGIMSMVLVLPAIYLAGFGVLTFYAAFPVIVGFRFIKMLWMNGIADTGWQATFNVAPPDRRDQTRAFVNGVPAQAGIVIAGVILLIGEQALEPQQLYLIGLVTAVLTTYFMWRARREYSHALVDALRAGQPHVFFSEEEPFGGFRRDASAVAAAVKGISSSDPAVRRVSAEILGHLSAPEATHALVDALDDADPPVRAAALRGLACANASQALLEVAACLHDPEPDVRLQAVEALRQLAGYPGGVASHIRPLLGDRDPAVRARVAVALLRAGPNPVAQATLESMAAAADAPSRVNALSALGECGSPETFDLVTAGLRDTLTTVRRAAAVAIVRIDAQRSIDPLIQALRTDDRTELEGLAAAIGQIGEPALDRSVAALSDPMLESGALLALESLPTAKAAPAIREYARTAVTRALHYHDLWRSMRPPNGDDRLRLLVESLQHAAQRHGTHALRAIGLLGDRQSMSVMIDNLKSRDPNQRANAIESLDSIGESHSVRPLLRLWEPAEAAPAAQPGGLLPVLQDTDAWLRACAALVAGGSPDPKVRSTLAQLAQADPDAVVREAAASALTGGTAMNTLATLSLMERVLFLRRVSLFADMSPADLKHVAALAGENFYSDGETLARQGDTGSEMYIIVSGEVRVLLAQDGGPDVEVARRQSGEYVGEMAIISQEPRSASLVAAGDVRTLCIDQKQFEGILRERPETGLAVMRVLIARLKEVERGARLHAPTTTPG